MNTSFGYVRVSTGRQDLSVAAQRAAIEKAVRFHCEGAELVLLDDADTSGGIPFAERPGGAAILKAVGEQHTLGLTSTLIVNKVDRLGRNASDIDRTVRQLEGLGCRVIFLDINVDTRTASGRAFMQIAAVFAELERAQIRERIQTVLDNKRSLGQLTGTVPYGWDAELREDGKRYLVDNEVEQQWILHMVLLRSLGYSWNAIAQDLNRQRVPTKNPGKVMRLSAKGGKTTEIKRTADRWTFGRVTKILQSKTVTTWLAQRAEQERKLAA